eukprot:13124522-Alexandrium_andersonii.AAC.1
MPGIDGPERIFGRRLGVGAGLQDQLYGLGHLLPGTRPSWRLTWAIEGMVLRENLVAELISELLK